VLALYLAADLTVNQSHYLVDEGHYRLGFHAIENGLSYVVTLYAGKRNLPSFVMVGVVLSLLLLRGTPRVIFATAWLLLAILPFSFFTWSTTSRYAYMPAVGMALLLVEGLAWLEAQLVRRMPRPASLAVIGLLGAFIAVRTERFRDLAAAVRERHPDPPPGTRIPVDAATVEAFQFRYVEALVQWEFRDPTLARGCRQALSVCFTICHFHTDRASDSIRNANREDVKPRMAQEYRQFGSIICLTGTGSHASCLQGPGG
jgi:hypothetical protein